MVRNWKVGEPNLKWSEAVELKPRELGLCLGGQREDTGTEAIEVIEVERRSLGDGGQHLVAYCFWVWKLNMRSQAVKRLYVCVHSRSYGTHLAPFRFPWILWPKMTYWTKGVPYWAGLVN